MNDKASARNSRPTSLNSRSRGFTLLEIMATLAIVGGVMVYVLESREKALSNFYIARNANIANSLARDLMSELAFKEPDDLRGGFDGYDGFEFEIEITREDLVSGESEEDDNSDPYSTNRDWKERDKEGTGSDSSSGNNSGGFTPGDSVFPGDEDEDQPEYPVRRIKVTVFYPNLREISDDPEPLKLILETILPPLPDEEDEEYNSPFGGNSNSGSGKSGSGKKRSN